jgi:hypothetical protein
MSVFNYGDDFCVPDEVIPACGARRTDDPRERQQTLPRIYGQRMSVRSEKGELIVTCGLTVNWTDIKRAAADHRRTGVLQTLVLLLDPDIYPELSNELAAKGFERNITREASRQREIAVVKRYDKKTLPRVTLSTTEPERPSDALTRQIEQQVEALDKAIEALKVKK